MATEIIMPKLSDTMTEGQLGAWRKSVGERIERGDTLAEVETDKAVMDLEAFTSGILLEQRVKAGELVPVGTVIGLIGAADEATVPLVTVATEPIPQAAAAPVAAAAVASVATATEPTPASTAGAPSIAPGVQAAPVVRRRAAELGIDLAGLAGSGPGGRIMLEDLQHVSSGVDLVPAPAGEPAAAIHPELRPLNRMRSAIARTTTSSWQNIPHFYLSRAVEMDQAEQRIHELKSAGTLVALNALIMAAAAAALTRFPALNAGFDAGRITRSAHVNLAFAVALADGLQVPVIKEAEAKNVRELTAATVIMAEKARNGTLAPADISGGSFTVSNLGMYGVDALASIIMPGQAAILGIGTIADRPVVRSGQLAIGRVMTATLSCDHRIIDGATAAGFLNECKRLLEQPGELAI
jgi:pyruvate dehydrogenase E2 component (dihydrolipoamide acetyltransferase)